jgi:hypothetical protein
MERREHAFKMQAARSICTQGLFVSTNLWRAANVNAPTPESASILYDLTAILAALRPNSLLLRRF